MSINIMLILIAIAVAVAIWYLLIRKKTLPGTPALAVTAIDPAPGVVQNTGNAPNNAPLPAPEGSVVPDGTNLGTVMSASMPGLGAGLFNQAAPSGGSHSGLAGQISQHVPIVGGAVRSAGQLVDKVAFGVMDKTNAVLSHVPIVGGIASSAGKTGEAALKKVSSWLGW